MAVFKTVENSLRWNTHLGGTLGISNLKTAHVEVSGVFRSGREGSQAVLDKHKLI